MSRLPFQKYCTLPLFMLHVPPISISMMLITLIQTNFSFHYKKNRYSLRNFVLIVSGVTPARPWLEYTLNRCVEEVAAWSRRSIVISFPTFLQPQSKITKRLKFIPVMTNPFNTELNPICHLLALLEAHHILHVSRIGVEQSVLSPQQIHCVFRAIIASYSDSRQIDVTKPRA